VELTTAGKQTIRRLRSSRQRVFAGLLADFSDSELERFGDYLQRLQVAFVKR
jgi:DNA-binding MarR family transcriptional regulator